MKESVSLEMNIYCHSTHFYSDYLIWCNERDKNGSNSCEHTILLLEYKTIAEFIEIYHNSRVIQYPFNILRSLMHS